MLFKLAQKIKTSLNQYNPITFFIFSFLIIIISIYFKSINYNLIFLDDDTLVFSRFTEHAFTENIINSLNTNYLGGHYYRPLTLISIILNSEIANNSFYIYHLSNLFLHILTSLFLLFILKNLGYGLLNSFFAVLLFSIAPIHINAVGWIAGRGDLLTAFFSVMAFYFFLKYLKKINIFLIIIVYILLFSAILAKEASLLVPFLFLLFYILERMELTINKKTVGILLMVVTVFGTYFFLRYLLQPDVFLDKFSFSEYFKNIFVLPETISKFFIPYNIKALSSFDLFATISGIVILIVLIAIPFSLSSISKSRYYFGLIWFFLLLLPGMVFRTMQQDGFYYWDCRSYLPLIGLSITLAEIIKEISSQKHRELLYTIIVFYLISLATTTFIKIDLYKNPITYWGSVKTDFPDRFLPYEGYIITIITKKILQMQKISCW